MQLNLGIGWPVFVASALQTLSNSASTWKHWSTICSNNEFGSNTKHDISFWRRWQLLLVWNGVQSSHFEHSTRTNATSFCQRRWTITTTAMASTGAKALANACKSRTTSATTSAFITWSSSHFARVVHSGYVFRRHIRAAQACDI